jgi:hypothetical protein
VIVETPEVPVGLRNRLWLLLGGGKPDAIDMSGQPVEVGVVQLAVSEVCASRLRDAGLHPNVIADTYGKNPRGPMARIFVPSHEVIAARALIEAFV